jgi:hypothetical protein
LPVARAAIVDKLRQSQEHLSSSRHLAASVWYASPHLHSAKGNNVNDQTDDGMQALRLARIGFIGGCLDQGGFHLCGFFPGIDLQAKINVVECNSRIRSRANTPTAKNGMLRVAAAATSRKTRPRSAFAPIMTKAGIHCASRHRKNIALNHCLCEMS